MNDNDRSFDRKQMPFSRKSHIRILLFASIFLVVHATTTQADDAFSGASSLWEVNTRAFPAAGTSAPSKQFQVRRASQSSWSNSNLDNLVDAGAVDQDPIRTIIYVHGNWTEGSAARERGWIIYHRLVSRAKEPIRFIVYSWDSERHGGIAKDLRSKPSRLHAESNYLANLLQKIPTKTPLGLLGYSFGGAVICGAMHIDAGGTLAGKSVEAMSREDADVRISLYASAFDRVSLSPNGAYGKAFSQTDQVLNLFNSHDPALKRFRFLDRKSSPVAVGFAGLVSFKNNDEQKDDAATPSILQVDVANQVGRTHSEMTYIQECSAFNYSLNNLLGF